MEQNYTPLYDALIRHRDYCPVSFHVPGHKNGAVFPEQAKATFGGLLSIDLTELPHLDDLHSPAGVIHEAQQLLSSFYGTKQSWFLVGGSTVGNLAMVYAACRRGSQVLVQRNSHKSVIHAVRLAGAKAVFLGPEIDQMSGLGTGPSIDTLKEAVEKYPQASALILTNPNYYGMAVDLDPLIKHAHRHHLAVLVDEAHGAHFALGRPFPNSALACGADAVVQSAHKTLPAMTMGAFLHIQGSRIESQAIDNALSMYESSSPSYPIMASLDLARFYLSKMTGSELDAIMQNIRRLRTRLGRFEQFTLIPSRANAYHALDPLKVTLQLRSGISGFELARRLESHGVYPELADPDHVLFVLPLGCFSEKKLIEAIELSLQGIESNGKVTLQEYPEIPRLSCPVELNGIEEKETVPLDIAEGEIAAQEVTPYPPGIPSIISGERISGSQIAAIRRWHAEGGRFQNGGDAVTQGIDVVVKRETKGE